MKLREVEFDAFVTYQDVKIKSYLSWEEMKDIYTMMLNQSNEFMRYYAKVTMVTQFCTNIDLEGMEDDAVFTLANKLGLPYEYSLSVCGYDELNEMVKNEESVYKLMEQFLPKIETMVSGMNMTDVFSQLESMKGVIESVDNK